MRFSIDRLHGSPQFPQAVALSWSDWLKRDVFAESFTTLAEQSVRIETQQGCKGAVSVASILHFPPARAAQCDAAGGR